MLKCIALKCIAKCIVEMHCVEMHYALKGNVERKEINYALKYLPRFRLLFKCSYALARFNDFLLIQHIRESYVCIKE